MKEPCFLFVRHYNYSTTSPIFFKLDIIVATGHLVTLLTSHISVTTT
jgi:hypothetical protein